MMLDQKGLPYEMVWLPAGIHPFLVRMRGFRGGTVPAMKIDGRRLQNSREISRALDELRADPPLFPPDPELKVAVEDAERWGETELQQVVRRIGLWVFAHRPETRVMIARDLGIRFPRFAAWVNGTVTHHLATRVDGEQLVGQAIADVPAALDHADELISRGVIGGDRPNAADFQVAISLRALMTIQDVRPVIDGHRSAELALKLVPDYGRDLPAGLLPSELLAPLR